jgi:16S rRNA (cytosine967-C5)-methyltransferase
MQISPARRAAFHILRRVEDEQAYASVLLAGADVDLNSKDRALCRQLVLGPLRRQLWLDRAVEHFAARRIDSFDLAVVIALRLGLYQLRFLSRIPASAAINESVNLVKAARVKSAAGLVNAILRRATREPDYDPAAEVDDEIDKVAIQGSHPRWLIERWADQFGFAEATAIAHANNEHGPVSFRLSSKAQRTAETIAELVAAGVEVTESAIASDAWRLRDSVGCDEAGRDAGVPQDACAAKARRRRSDLFSRRRIAARRAPAGRA